MPYRVTVIMVNGAVVESTQPKEPDLAQLQKAVGGYIEKVPHLDRYKGLKGDAFINEEGRNNNLPLNILATEAWLACLGPGPFRYKPELFGDMIFVAKEPVVKDGDHRTTTPRVKLKHTRRLKVGVP